MKRSEIWTAAGGGGYTGKPRPVVIIQDDRFDATASVTVCPFTTDPTEAPLIRLVVDSDGSNGLRERSSLMVDKITTVRRGSLGERVGGVGRTGHDPFGTSRNGLLRASGELIQRVSLQSGN